MKARVLANPFRIELRSDVAYGLPTKWTQQINAAEIVHVKLVAWHISGCATTQELAAQFYSLLTGAICTL
jgi:hypothetical protein